MAPRCAGPHVGVVAGEQVEVAAQHGGLVPGVAADRRQDGAEQVVALGERDAVAAAGRQVRGAGEQGAVDAEPGSFLGVREVLRRVGSGVHSGRRARRLHVGQQPDAEPLAVAAAGVVPARAVAGGLERAHDGPAGVDGLEDAPQGGQVVRADLVESDHIRCLGGDHLGGPGHRPAGVAAGAATVAEVHLEHPQDRGLRGDRGVAGCGRRCGRRCGWQRGGGDEAAHDHGSAQEPVRTGGHTDSGGARGDRRRRGAGDPTGGRSAIAIQSGGPRGHRRAAYPLGVAQWARTATAVYGVVGVGGVVNRALGR